MMENVVAFVLFFSMIYGLYARNYLGYVAYAVAVIWIASVVMFIIGYAMYCVYEQRKEHGG